MESNFINPTTGLPMVDGDYGGVDVGGNLYGTDYLHHNPWSSSHTGWNSDGLF